MGKKLTHEAFIDKVKHKNPHFASGEIDILGEYTNSRSHIQCKCNVCGHIWSPIGHSLCSTRGCPECGKKIGRAQLSHEEFVERINSLNRGFVIIGTYVKADTKVKMQCVFGHIWDALPSHLFNGVGCPYCAGKKVWIGFNDLWTTRPDVAQLLKNPEDGYSYTQKSAKQATFICPECNNESTKRIVDVCTDGLSCQMCSDGISYPNKFGRAFLCQLPINNLTCEYSPFWAHPYIYDNYFQYQGVEYILEMDGGFHYMDNSLSGVSLKQQQNIDAVKNELAISNNIHIIRINCLKSDKKYISHNILKSELANVFDLSNIDWDLCDKKAQKSLVKTSCDLYRSESNNLREIANVLHISHNTVRRYIKKGKEFGWC